MKINKKLAAAVLLIFLLLGFWFSLPKKLFKTPYATVLLDKKGQLLQARIASDGQWRFEPSYAIPDKFEKAIVCFEDKRFFRHLGFDPLAFARAIYLNLKSGTVVSGGSTLSMQVIRMSRQKPRTFFEKIIEIVLAFRLELSYSKKEILQLYAAHAPFGGNVVGLQAAAWRYFGREAAQLSWGEICSLAVLPNSPSLVRPDKNSNALLDKRNKLLNKLLQTSQISEETHLLSLLEPIPQKPLPLPNYAPNLLSSLSESALQISLAHALVQTTLSKELQIQTNEILELHHQKLKGNGVNNIAALILDIEKNEVMAYAGNVFHPEDAAIESYVDMIPAKRSPGSTLKPLLYAAMLHEALLLPKTLLADIPTQVAGYMPQNFNLSYDGAVPADIALARSLNVPAVRMLQQYRTERFYDLLNRLGIHSLNKGPSHYGLSLILGGGENSMWEISSVYASLARQLNHFGSNSGRFEPKDFAYPKVLIANSAKAIDTKSTLAPLNAGAIWHMFEAMQDLVRPGEEENWSQFISSRRVAWKTGTSFGFRDAWAIGLTPGYLVCVWAGNADGEGRPGLTGVQAAAPVLFDLIKLLPRTPWFEKPFDNLNKQIICRQSGNKSTEFCTYSDTVWVPKTKAPQPNCNYHQGIHLDKLGRYRVSSQCESPSNMQHVSWFVLPPAMEWYFKNKSSDYKPLPPWKPGCKSEEEQTNMMEIIYPKRLSSLYIPKEIDGQEGKAIIELAHRNRNIKVFWYLNGTYLGSTKEFHQLGISPPAGKHLLLVEDENGERIELPFEVVRNLPK